MARHKVPRQSYTTSQTNSISESLFIEAYSQEYLACAHAFLHEDKIVHIMLLACITFENSSSFVLNAFDNKR